MPQLTNEEMLNIWASKNNIQKNEGGIVDMSTANFGGLIPYAAVYEIISLARAQNQWMSSINTVTRSSMTGTIPIQDFSEPAMEMVSSNDGTKVGNQPVTSFVRYATKKFKSELYITTEELREAAAAGLASFESKLTSDWATQLGNDLANLSVNADTSITDVSTRSGRMLRAVDGIDKRTTAGGVVTNAAGKAFSQGVFAAMYDTFPEKYIQDGGLSWWYGRRVDNAWRNSLTNMNTTEHMRSAMGDAALTQLNVASPLGIPSIIVPQISSSKGPAAVAPTSVVDGTTYLTINVNAIAATTLAGRKVRVTLKATGASEVCVVSWSSPNNTIVTTGTLLQTGTNSTTAADYVVQLCDETDLYLGNPKNVNLVLCNQWRSYREFNKDFDRYEVTTYIELDLIIPTPQMIVKFTRVTVPAVSW